MRLKITEIILHRVVNAEEYPKQQRGVGHFTYESESEAVAGINAEIRDIFAARCKVWHEDGLFVSFRNNAEVYGIRWLPPEHIDGALVLWEPMGEEVSEYETVKYERTYRPPGPGAAGKPYG